MIDATDEVEAPQRERERKKKPQVVSQSAAFLFGMGWAAGGWWRASACLSETQQNNNICMKHSELKVTTMSYNLIAHMRTKTHIQRQAEWAKMCCVCVRESVLLWYKQDTGNSLNVKYASDREASAKTAVWEKGVLWRTREVACTGACVCYSQWCGENSVNCFYSLKSVACLEVFLQCALYYIVWTLCLCVWERLSVCDVCMCQHMCVRVH